MERKLLTWLTVLVAAASAALAALTGNLPVPGAPHPVGVLERSAS